MDYIESPHVTVVSIRVSNPFVRTIRLRLRIVHHSTPAPSTGAIDVIKITELATAGSFGNRPPIGVNRSDRTTLINEDLLIEVRSTAAAHQPADSISNPARIITKITDVSTVRKSDILLVTVRPPSPDRTKDVSGFVILAELKDISVATVVLIFRSSNYLFSLPFFHFHFIEFRFTGKLELDFFFRVLIIWVLCEVVMIGTEMRVREF